ncbi:hypothetical protein PR048_000582 [Dryococelus australis]|uniref:Uncharacterized protein n=1 Tax=Dryococelus australis TaxID=614101 RepID=A0ABQ9IF31_9NEOP|nr:hypothetical protein PR048_000582 [Dryococelus australis]
MKGRGKREIPEKTRRPTVSSGTIPTCGDPVTRPGIEPGSPWWEASRLIAQPPRPQTTRNSEFIHPVSFEWSTAPGGKPFDISSVTISLGKIMKVEQHACKTHGINNSNVSSSLCRSNLIHSSGALQVASWEQLKVLAHLQCISFVVKPHFKANFSVQCEEIIHRRFVESHHTSYRCFRISRVGMKGWEKRDISEKARRLAASSAMIPTCENPGVGWPEIEPGSPWWEASRLTAQPQIMTLNAGSFLHDIFSREPLRSREIYWQSSRPSVIKSASLH